MTDHRAEMIWAIRSTSGALYHETDWTKKTAERHVAKWNADHRKEGIKTRYSLVCFVESPQIGGAGDGFEPARDLGVGGDFDGGIGSAGSIQAGGGEAAAAMQPAVESTTSSGATVPPNASDEQIAAFYDAVRIPEEDGLLPWAQVQPHIKPAILRFARLLLSSAIPALAEAGLIAEAEHFAKELGTMSYLGELYGLPETHATVNAASAFCSRIAALLRAQPVLP